MDLALLLILVLLIVIFFPLGAGLLKTLVLIAAVLVFASVLFRLIDRY
jgi:hypothetical protein